MLTILRNETTGAVILATTDRVSRLRGDLVDRWSFKSYADAEAVAADCNRDLAPRVFLATDAGPSCSPRYDVIEAPKVGDPVSYAFNGDSYPCGAITKISASYSRIVAVADGVNYETGEPMKVERVFYRASKSGSWRYGRTWSLVRGHVETRNPHL